MNDAKPWYLSKTILVNCALGVGLIAGNWIPGVNEFIQNHLTAAGNGWAVINIALRLITKKEIG